jgi:FeS assembly protein IscX
MDFLLSWDDSYEIALELRRLYPNIPMEDVSIEMIFQWTVALTRFQDDIEVVNDGILQAIYRDWLEEVITNE